MFPVDLCRGEGLHTAGQGEAVVPGLLNHLIVLQEEVINEWSETGQGLNFSTLLITDVNFAECSVVQVFTYNQFYD